jgi:two-component system LytT family response regulator
MGIKIGVVDYNLLQKQELIAFLKSMLTFEFEIVNDEEIFLKANNETDIDIVLIEQKTFHNNPLTKFPHISDVTFGIIIYCSESLSIERTTDLNSPYYNFLKPLDKFELILKINELVLKIIEKKIKLKKQNRSKLTLKFAKELHYINLKEIKFLKADGNYTKVHLSNAKIETVSKTLKSFENLLTNPHFFRPHQSYIVNLDYVQRYLYEGTLILNEGETIPVARKEKEMMLKILNT